MEVTSRVVIIIGSKGDLEWSKRIKKALDRFGNESITKVASAHKVSLKCYELVKEYEKEDMAFITVAGKSNTSSGFTDSQTYCPVITCPPYSDKFTGTDIFYSLRMSAKSCPRGGLGY